MLKQINTSNPPLFLSYLRNQKKVCATSENKNSTLSRIQAITGMLNSINSGFGSGLLNLSLPIYCALQVNSIGNHNDN
jgi:hypothetical protein